MAEITYEKGFKSNLARQLEGITGRKTHSLFCKCEECIPPWLKEEMKFWPVVTKGMYERQEPPVAKILHKPEKRAPRKSKWTDQRGNSGN